PPLAIIGFVLTFLFLVLLIKKSYGKFTKFTGASLWLFTFLGLVTGMIWAQLAWGSYWSWDPKETLTLALFLTLSAAQVMYFEKRYSASKWLMVLSCVLTVMTALSSFIIEGLHTYA
ncbi:MAG TPA: cytochrome c biogenesis protein CcsA, partial [Candidatus Acidoferrales bacterium]|nr:cytochrome c biogenesis protein CcsA [Candidatus Acidoferrales bacterium]